jgi:divalent metal cation (Fe/Co/Zn/Cd) transporter
MGRCSRPDGAGLAVVLAIFISALVALGQTIERFIHPRSLSHLWLLAAAGVIGFVRRKTPSKHKSTLRPEATADCSNHRSATATTLGRG